MLSNMNLSGTGITREALAGALSNKFGDEYTDILDTITF
jgi:hypothetical protein